MADLVVKDDIAYKRRNPWGVFGFSLITLGVYWFVWYYKTNNHLKNYGIDNNPALATLAVTLGALVVVPVFVSSYRTAVRIRAAQERAGASERILPWLALLLAVVFEPAAGVYYQAQINKVWDAEAQGGARVLPA